MRLPHLWLLLACTAPIAPSRARAQIPILPPATVAAPAAPDGMVLGGARGDSVGRPPAESPLRELLPVRDETTAMRFWQQTSTKALAGGSVFAENNVIGANLELVSDIIGVFRVGFGVTASGSDSDNGAGDEGATEAAQEEAIADLVQSGGTAHLNAAWPVFATRADRPNIAALVVSGRAAWENPSNGAEGDEDGVAGVVGMDFLYRRMGVGRVLNFEAGVFGHTYTFNDAYADLIKTSESWGAVAGARAALVIGAKTRVGVTFRPVRTATFDELPRVAFFVQQVNTP